jgi:hypothetical protein
MKFDVGDLVKLVYSSFQIYGFGIVMSVREVKPPMYAVYFHKTGRTHLMSSYALKKLS